MITKAPTDEATAAAIRGPGPNTALPCGNWPDTNSPTIGEATTTPTAKAHRVTVTAAIRLATGRDAIKYTVPKAKIGTLATAPMA